MIGSRFRKLERAAHDLEHGYSRDSGLRARLSWAHGSERAAAIIAGEDLQAAADLVAWRDLGEPRDAEDDQG